MNSMKVALNSMRRNPAMNIASCVLVFLTLLIFGVGGLITVNTANASKSAVDNLAIYVWPKADASQEQVNEIVNQIQQKADIEQIEVETKDQVLESFADNFDDRQSFLDLFGGTSNPLSDQIKVRLVDGNQILEVSEELRQIEGVEDVKSGDDDSTSSFITMMHSALVFSIGVACILLVISVFIIMNTIKLAITSRSLEIEIMRLVGATKQYVRMPFIWEGIFIGLIGALLSFVVLFFGYQQIMNFVGQQTGGIQAMFIPLDQATIMLFVGITCLGVLVGGIGSILSTNKYLKK